MESVHYFMVIMIIKKESYAFFFSFAGCLLSLLPS